MLRVPAVLILIYWWHWLTLVDVRGCQTKLTAHDLMLTMKSESCLRGRCCQSFLSIAGQEVSLVLVLWTVYAFVEAVVEQV